MSDLIRALTSGKQADEDGTMCVVSRQACYEAAERIEYLEVTLNEILETFYGQNLEVANWHKNGELEPMDNFFDGNDWHIPKEDN